ncbi:MFS transporter [Streptomyces longispororuber]|uniref:MFS transporter n=1 Tax=Streptomyces longispororuber TaxID=68230 RepID=UPI00210E52AB|nr:MFS transporter [Streptomyces longispororuber]MCQ4207965.1 MFS transporter [Streptomyces longispororuber]
MTHAQIMRALSGLLLGLFCAILSSTVVTNALPRIIGDLGGGQSAYTWVVTASLLAVTASTPLWGKLADQFSKKILVQSSLVVFVLGSLLAGLAQNPATLIGARVVQGLGGGGLSALAQVVLAAMISPRERGRYSGYLGATFAVATVGGPLLGGVITDTSWLGWRWCLFVGIPFAVVALVVLQRTLDLPVIRRQVKVDWAGSFFVTAAVCVLLVWVTFADDKYAWLSWQTYTLVGAAILLTLVFLFVETKASEPVIPLRLFRNPTIALASVASLFVGIALFAGTVFFSQYFQLARGASPTMSGVMTIPFIAGLFVSSTVSGRIITRTGKWKGWLLAGGVLLSAGLALLGMLRYDTSYLYIAFCMALMGLGVGMTLQNLVLCTQNQVSPGDLGAASSTVTFFRSLGGAVGVSVLGSVLTTRIGHYARETITQLDAQDRATAATASGGGRLPDLALLPAPVRTWLEGAYGHGIGDVFLYVAPIALLALLVTLFIKEVPLRASSGLAQAAEAGRTASEVPAGIAVHGRIRVAGGDLVPAGEVTLTTVDGSELGRSAARPEGSYTLDVPGAGQYVLIASADGYRPQTSTIVVAEEPVAHDILLTVPTG